jgi:hypothetical protein
MGGTFLSAGWLDIRHWPVSVRVVVLYLKGRVFIAFMRVMAASAKYHHRMYSIKGGNVSKVVMCASEIEEASSSFTHDSAGDALSLLRKTRVPNTLGTFHHNSYSAGQLSRILGPSSLQASSL